jgi:hypothetical protein
MDGILGTHRRMLIDMLFSSVADVGDNLDGNEFCGDAR